MADNGFFDTVKYNQKLLNFLINFSRYLATAMPDVNLIVDTGKKMNILKISRFSDFIQCFPDFSQRFPDFSLIKFFEVRKCERCGSLNPRLLYFRECSGLRFVVRLDL